MTARRSGAKGRRGTPGTPGTRPAGRAAGSAEQEAWPDQAAGQALTAACADVRAAGLADSVAGVQPSYVAAPDSTQEAAAVMRAAAGLGLAVAARGTGSRLSWGLPPAACDLVVETRRLDSVVEHAAADLVVTVQAGVRLEDLAGVLGQARQQLSLDVPVPAGGSAGTIGGVLATGMAGPVRLRYGPPRDLVIGMTVVRPDGQVTRSGGKVVKNVAGYDLGKLFTGSYGTLGLIADATFRLHPLPAASAWVTCEGDPAAVAAGVAAVLGSSVQPSAVEIDRPARGAPLRLGVLLEGYEQGIGPRSAAVAEAIGEGAQAAAEPPGWWGRGAAAAIDSTLIRVAFWTGQLAAVLQAIDAAAVSAGLDPLLGGSAGAGVLYAAIEGVAGPEAVAEFVTGLRAALARPAAGRPPSVRGSVVVLNAPPMVRAAVDMWGEMPGAALMRAIKREFDPANLMAPGRLGEGI